MVVTDGVDVLIVDTNSDLNVYVTAKEDGSGPCCGSNDSAEGTQGFVDKIKTEFKGIDFNEWAGKCDILLVSVSACLLASYGYSLTATAEGSFKIFAIKL